MIDFSQFNSLIALTTHFNNEDICRKAIVETRWGCGEQQDVATAALQMILPEDPNEV